MLETGSRHADIIANKFMCCKNIVIHAISSYLHIGKIHVLYGIEHIQFGFWNALIGTYFTSNQLLVFSLALHASN